MEDLSKKIQAESLYYIFLAPIPYGKINHIFSWFLDKNAATIGGIPSGERGGPPLQGSAVPNGTAVPATLPVPGTYL